MADSRYLQDGFDKQLAHVVEECGEVLHAAGKIQRWGRYSVNPLLPPEKQEPNIEWLKRELPDLKLAISRLELTIVRDESLINMEVTDGSNNARSDDSTD